MVNIFDMKLNEDRIPYLVKSHSRKYSGKSTTAEEAVGIINNVFDAQNLPQENVWAIALDNKLKCIALFLISVGTCNSSLLSSKDIMARLILSGASNFIIAHNHPSGDPSPSNEDTCISNLLKNCGNMMDIHMVDFIIIGQQQYYSFAENAIL